MLGLVTALEPGNGCSVMKRIAAPMVGGMVTSTVLTLVVIPGLCYLWRRRVECFIILYSFTAFA